MRTTNSLAVLFITLFSFLVSPLQAQLPSCEGSGSGLIYFLGDPNGVTKLYNWDPSLPFSATNPVLNTISLPPGSYPSILSVGNNLSTASPSPTFYISINGMYYYYDGSTWINTGNSSGPGSSGGGGGGNYIYSYDAGSSGKIYKYDGNGNAADDRAELWLLGK
jgi:hypothetical protein